MQARCPHCHTPIELDSDGKLSDIVCPSCGSSFSLLGGDETVAYTPGETKTLGHFELLDQIGVGNFGFVYRARDTDLDRPVAVKIPRKGQLDPDETEQFLREARAAAQLRHPGIVTVHEVGRDDDTVYIVSDFIEGVTLADRLTAQPFSMREAAELCAKIADALNHAHESGVIHRDLKPSNIILDAAGEPHIMDFGLARREAGDVTMTVEGKVLGTPAYMSPEQAKGNAHTADRRSDVYSLGVILFELLTGERPFRGNIRMLVHQVINDEAPSPRRLNGSVPRDLETICLKCMEKEPENRYETARALGDDFRRFLKGESIKARPITRMEWGWRWSKRNPVVAVLATAFVVAIMVGLSGVTWQWIRAENEADKNRQLLYIADMNVAGQAWEKNNVGRVVELLRRHVPQDGEEDLRGFEWYYLWRQCKRSPLLLRIETGIATGLAFSTNSQTITVVNSNADADVTVWNISTGQPLEKFGKGETWYPYMAISPNGSLLAYSAENSPVIRLRNLVANDGEVEELVEHTRAVHDATFSPDGKLLATASADGTIKIWRVDDRKVLKTLDRYNIAVNSVAFSPNSKLVASGNSDQIVRIWDWSRSEELLCLEGHKGKINCVAFSPDGMLLASGSENGEIIVWDAASGESLDVLSTHQDAVRSVAFSPDGVILASGSRDNTIKLWDVATRSELETLRGHSGIVNVVAFSTDGKLLASGSQDYTVMVWDLRRPRYKDYLAKDRKVATFSFMPKSGHLLALSDGVVSSWNIKTGEETENVIGEDTPLRTIATTRDGLVVGIDAKRRLRIWRLDTHEKGKILSEGESRKYAKFPPMAISPSGTIIALACQDKTVELHDLRNNTPLSTLRGHSRAVQCITFNPDGTTLATGSEDNSVKLWDVGTGKLMQTLTDHRDTVNCVAFTPGDGRTLVSGSFDNTIKVWDWRHNVHAIETLRGHSASVWDLLFSEDGKTLFSAAGDRTVKVWDVLTWQERFTFSGHTSAVSQLAKSPNERMLASSTGRSIRLWRAATKEEVEAAGEWW